MTSFVLSRNGWTGLVLLLTIGHATHLTMGQAPVPRPPSNAAYEALFGTEDKKVSATASTKDDAKFAAVLLEKAKNLTDDPVLVEYIYLKAFEFGLKDPEGFTTADEALRKLDEAKAFTPEELASRRSELLKQKMNRGTSAEKTEAANVLIEEQTHSGDQLVEARQYAAAMKTYKDAARLASSVRSVHYEDLDGKIKDLQVKLNALEKVLKLKSQLAAKPGDLKLINDIIDSAIAELDDPAAASEAASKHPDAATKEVVQLATKNREDLSESELLTLARWLRKLGDRTAGPSKATALEKSFLCYGNYLDLHSKQDGDRLVAQQQREEVLTALAAIGRGGILADQLVIWNAHNGPNADRGTALINVRLSNAGKTVWEKKNIELPWDRLKDPAFKIDLPKVTFNNIHIDILKFRGLGGGLSEVQVFRGKDNVATKARVFSSGALADRFPATTLIDGKTDSSEFGNYWLLPSGQPGWAELSFGR